MKNNNPKRRKSRDNPYIIKHVENSNTYIVIFNSNNIENKIQISKEIYEALNQFELDDLKQLNEKDRHYERLEQSEEFLFKRSFNKNKSVEDIVEEKIMNDKLKTAINMLSNIQKRRIKKYYFDSKTLDEIALEEHTSHQAISKSIASGIEQIKKNLNL